MTAEERIAKALELIESYGGVDGSHHKAWAIDQLVRVLAEDYGAWVQKYERPDGEDTADDDVYEWEPGIAP
jgi:hypothetical protein